MYKKINFDIAKIASKQDYKPEIASVLFTTDGRTVATDSCRLIEISRQHDADAFDTVPDELAGRKIVKKLEKDILINAAELVKLKIVKPSKTLPALNSVFFADIKDNTAELISTNLKDTTITPVRIVEGSYPEYTKLLKQIDDSARDYIEIPMNGEFLAEVAEIMATINATSDIILRVPKTPNKPIEITAYNSKSRVHGRAVLMPLNK